MSSNSSLVAFVCGVINGGQMDHAKLGVDDNCVQCYYGQSYFSFSLKVVVTSRLQREAGQVAGVTCAMRKGELEMRPYQALDT
jgi:hypothetical protein